MKTLNLGILAHVDAGKTSLTERLLFNAGVIKTLGSVDQGNTQTDSMDLERKRGITIKSAVVSFDVDDLKINLIDTPGHPDFIAEVERALSVLDAAVLVISAVEGIQPQTRILMRTLQKLQLPTIIFINKIDRIGARDQELLDNIEAMSSLRVIAMNTVINGGSRQASVQASPQVVDLYAYMGATRHCPVFFGSAMTGAGVPELTRAFTYFLPSKKLPDITSILSGVIFKIERSPRGEKIAYARIYSGQVRLRDTIDIYRHTANEEVHLRSKVTAIGRFQDGATKKATLAYAGDIVTLRGLSNCFIGDSLGRIHESKGTTFFARPSLEVVINSSQGSQQTKLHNALTQMSEQDPLIHIRQNKRDNILSIQLYGEVQKEVIKDTLANDFGIAIEFQETTTLHVERPEGKGEAVEAGERGDPFLATIGLRIEPTLDASEVQFHLSSEVLGTMPSAFFKAVEDTVKDTLHQGLYGWQVIGCKVTMTHAGFFPRQSHAHARFDKSMSSTGADFRGLTPLVLMKALKQAHTAVYEPFNHFELDIPETMLAQVLRTLAAHEARLEHAPTVKQSIAHVEGTLPSRLTARFTRIIPDITQGEGTLTTEFGKYEKVQETPPTQKRTDNDPLDREEYIRRTLRRTGL